MKKILCAGGGTLGPVAPLLAVADRLREADNTIRILWAGTDSGPEREMIERRGIPFTSIPVAKLTRYASRQLLTLPFDYMRARMESARLLDREHPNAVLSAGGFTAVPVVREAYRRRIPCLSHQLDYETGLSNRMISRYCRYVTTSFSYMHSPFPAGTTTYVIPTPTRFRKQDLPSRESACRAFALDPTKPVLLVTGGGTGARTLNDAMSHIRKRFSPEVQIIHLIGKGKSPDLVSDGPGYAVLPFLADEMIAAYAAADIVVSRAGMGAISELAALQKSAVLVPLPNSPQIQNARELKDAVIIVEQGTDGWMEELRLAIESLLKDSERRRQMGIALFDALPTDDGSALANLALSVML